MADGTENGARKNGQANLGFDSEKMQGSATAQESPAVLQLESEQNNKKTTLPKPKKESWMDGVIDNSCRENSWFGKKCLKIFKVFSLILYYNVVLFANFLRL